MQSPQHLTEFKLFLSFPFFNWDECFSLKGKHKRNKYSTPANINLKNYRLVKTSFANRLVFSLFVVPYRLTVNSFFAFLTALVCKFLAFLYSANLSSSLNLSMLLFSLLTSLSDAVNCGFHQAGFFNLLASAFFLPSSLFCFLICRLSASVYFLTLLFFFFSLKIHILNIFSFSHIID